MTFGERAADVMRNAFGSWAFVGSFLLFMAIWMVLNTAILGAGAFDKYPWILLNLMLSMMAGLQGALILIAAKRADRVAAEQATAHYAETAKLDNLLSANNAMTEEIRQLAQSQSQILARLQSGDEASAAAEQVRADNAAAEIATAQEQHTAPAGGDQK